MILFFVLQFLSISDFIDLRFPTIGIRAVFLRDYGIQGLFSQIDGCYESNEAACKGD